MSETDRGALRAVVVSTRDAVTHRWKRSGFARAMRVLHNRWLQLVSYKKGHLLSWAEPDIFQIEPTNHCNLKCPMCPHDLMTREVGFMDFDLFRSAVDQVCGYSSSIRLHNMGESLFHKRIDELIGYARLRGMRTVLSTNASALTTGAGRRIIEAGLDKLLISFDGSNKNTYEYFRQGAKYDKVLDKVEAFLALRSQRGSKRPHVTMSLINMPMTRGEISEFERQWGHRVDAIRFKPPRNWDGSSERINNLVGLPDKRESFGPCAWLWSSLVVLWDGRVVPCCMDYDGKAVLGSIKEKSLSEIFNDSAMQELRRLHVEGRASESRLCRGCTAPTAINGALSNIVAGAGEVLLSSSRDARKRS